MEKLFEIYDDKHPVLRQICKKVELPLSNEKRKLILEMVQYLKNSQDEEFAEKNNIRPGVGIAAPQIGIAERFVALYYVNENDEVVQYGLVNPRIMVSSVKKAALRCGEGCLSVKEDQPGYVYRHYKITVKAFDAITNKEITINARGYDAIVLQHELDHLDGILYYDRINKKDPTGEIENSVLI